jgi:Domain of unknown function (DUF4055)
MRSSSSPPTTDPNLPSFHHPNYAAVLSELELVSDVWADLKDCQRRYLPQELKEPPKAYANRLKRTQFDNRFSPALKGHAGLLSDFALAEDAPASIRDFANNIDLQGGSLEVFLEGLDEIVLRDGGAGLLVEFPPEPKDEQGNSLIVSAADQAMFEMRPYLVAIDRRNIPNWDIAYVHGKPVLRHLTIRENHLVADGDFGTTEKTYYRVLRPGTWEVWELVEHKGKWSKVLIDSGETGIEAIPFVWYAIAESRWFEGMPPFLNLARLNIEHYQKRSGLNEVLHKCNLPVPVREGLVRGIEDFHNQERPIPPLMIGPNSALDVPQGGKFYFAEPSGSAIAQTQLDIEKLEGAMDRVSLAFLTGGEAAKTATEVVMDSSQTQCTLKGLARRKESLVQTAFQFWAEYTGESGTGGIQVNESILQLPANPQEVQVILDAMGLKISTRLALHMLLARKWLPSGTDIEAEAAMQEGVDLLPNALVA